MVDITSIDVDKIYKNDYIIDNLLGVNDDETQYNVVIEDSSDKVFCKRCGRLLKTQSSKDVGLGHKCHEDYLNELMKIHYLI